MHDEKRGLWIGVTSFQRPHNVAKMTEKIGTEVTWYVRNEEERAIYEKAGAKHIKVTTKDPGNLVQKRNEILEDAWGQNLTAMILADDLASVDLVVHDPTSKKGKHGGLREVATPFWDSIDYMLTLWNETPGMDRFKLGGVIPVPNLYFHHGTIRTDLFIIGDMMIVRPCDTFFDERFRFKSDYDYTMQHLEKFGGVFRCDDVFLRFAHYGNRGGQVVFRTEEQMEAANALLREKWGEHIIPHPKRSNEILLKWKPKRTKEENVRAYHRSIEKVLVKPEVSGTRSTTDNNKIRILTNHIKGEAFHIQKQVALLKQRYERLMNMKEELQTLLGDEYIDPAPPIVRSEVSETETETNEYSDGEEMSPEEEAAMNEGNEADEEDGEGEGEDQGELIDSLENGEAND